MGKSRTDIKVAGLADFWELYPELAEKARKKWRILIGSRSFRPAIG